jgi:lysyl-tRNA synthetase class 2
MTDGVVPRRPAHPDAPGLRDRAAVLAAIRRLLDSRGYLEVPTPVLVPSAALEEHLYPVSAAGGLLRTSPEFALKRVVAAGLPRVYEIGPCFRDREQGPWHAREFTMLEWYRAGAGLADLMDETESVIGAAAAALGVPLPAFQRLTVRELFQTYAGLDLATASADQLSPRDPHSWDDAFFRRWVDDVEPRLTGALIVHGWPASQAALAAVRTDGAWPVAERFEVFLDGIELANAFHELVDGRELLRRFAASNAARAAAGEAPHPVDLDLIDAVAKMPPTSGIAVGVERLVAALRGWPGIGAAQVP